MGSSGSRMGSRPSRPKVNRTRRVLSSFICGCSSSHSPVKMEDYPVALLEDSAENYDQAIGAAENSIKESLIVSGTGTGFTSADTESGASSVSSTFTSENSSVVDSSRVTETLRSKELVDPYQVSAAHSHDESYAGRNTARASTSAREQQTSDPVNVSANSAAVNDIDNSVDKGASQMSPEIIHHSPCSQELEEPCTDGLSDENHIHNSSSGSVLTVSDTPLNLDSIEDETLQQAIPSDLGFLVSNREQVRGDGSMLHVDVVSISSNALSNSNADISNRDARRNSRRLFWDAFSRRNSRRHSDSPTIVFSTDDTDDLGSHGRWLLDFGGDVFEDEVRGDFGYLGSRIHSINERRRQSRSEIWERLRGGINESGRRTAFCPSGLHPDGTCSCESFLMTEESSTRASISRIVMLAEALFEVLDEIHRQPLSLSLSMVSLPAPESVVDSFPLKNHKKSETAVLGDEVEQCYICLSEYEEGDKIRVLPCHHEYHMSCVDKWLKEIHGVCPLCRGDVCEGFMDHSVSAAGSS